MKPKEIIIDKDAFVGIKLKELCDFAHNHILILPLVLYDECSTNDEKQQELLSRFRKLLLSGGYICASGMDIVTKEGETLKPYGFLADLDETNKWRKALKEDPRLINPNNDDDIRERRVEVAKFLLEYNKEIAEKLALKKLREAEVRRSWLEANRLERYRFWFDAIDCQDVHALIREESVKFTNSPDRFCLSSAWVYWHFVRLVYAIYLDYYFLKRGQGAETEQMRALHDLNDIEYVLLLSRADGLLTRDEKLVKPLAQAAFPEKDVFSSLDEVPEEYVCHWS
jgi:hypothetical protein